MKSPKAKSAPASVPRELFVRAVGTANTQISLLRARLSAFLGQSHSGARDLYSAFGYDVNVQVEHLQAMYVRNDIANRIISAFPNATWSDPPLVGDKNGDSCVEDAENFSPFAKAWDDLCRKRKVLHYMERADRLSSVGQYGVLLLGFKDGKPLDQPVSGKAELAYLQPYSQTNAMMSVFDTNSSSERFGLPQFYTLQQGQEEQAVGQTGSRTLRVHHSRVIHLAEGADQSDLMGKPRLLAIYNRLKDLEKVVGGASETYWITSNRGMAFWLDENTDLEPGELDDFKEQIEEFQHSLRRSLIGRGMTAQSMGAEVEDPSPLIEKLLDLIAGTVGMPKRILVGSERGELASSQDEMNWSNRIDERRRNHAVPNILREFIQKMIDTGNLPKPNGEFMASWPKPDLGPQAQADILTKRTQALVSYANSATAAIIVPEPEFRRDFLNMTPESEYEPLEIERPDDGVDEEEMINGQVPKPDKPADEDKEEEVANGRKPFANAAPRTLYVSRSVLNTGAIKKWAREQGFKNIEQDLHVTVMYSTEPVDWMKASQAWDVDENGGISINAGGPRLVEKFEGGKRAIVMSFRSWNLEARHSELIVIGCKPSHPTYQPHITISYDEPGFSDEAINKIEAYQGVISLGPEIFREVE